MKKAIILGAIAAVLALSIALGIKTWKTNESTLLMANLEALTNPEETNPDPEKGDGKDPGEKGEEEERHPDPSTAFWNKNSGRCAGAMAHKVWVSCYKGGPEPECNPSDC